jgi:hypothetical protein
MLNILISGLTPREHFRLHATLPANIIEQILDQLDDLGKLLDVSCEIAPDLEHHVFRNREDFDLQSVSNFQRIVRSLHEHA